MALAPIDTPAAEPAYRGIELVPAGGPQNWVLAHDLDVDGHPDLLFLLATGETSVFRGTPDGLVSSTPLPGTFPDALHATAGFIDGDDHPDLVVTTRTGARVLHGNGDATFREGAFLGAIFFGRFAVIARIDSDAHADVAFADEQAGVVRVHLGDGAGIFVHAGDATPGDEPHSLEAADLDADGKLDFITPHGNSEIVSILLGDGTGKFQSAPQIPMGSNNRYVAASDLDGNGVLDLAVSNRASFTVSTVLGKGDGTFGPATALATSMEPEFLDAADLDEDSRPDVIVLGSTPIGALSVHRNEGGGALGQAGTIRIGRDPLGFALEDMTGDGRLDAVVASSTSSFGSIARGRAGGRFVESLRIELEADPVKLAAADLDGNAVADLVCTPRNDPSLRIAVADGKGGFEPERKLDLPGAPLCAAVARMDGDDAADIVWASATGGVSVLLGSAGLEYKASGSAEAGILPGAIAALDWSGDGALDLAIANAASQDVSLIVGDGKGGIASSETLAASAGASDVIASDLDGDGTLDLAVACPDAAKVHVYLGEKGAFSASPPLDLPGRNPDAAAAGEVDGDGKSDLVVADLGGTILLLRGKGDGSFEDAVEIGECGAASSIVLADPDMDGRLDIAASCTLWDAVLALRSSGAGSWDPILYESGRLPVTLAAADLTGDGLGDLAAGDTGSRSITVLPADGPEAPAGLFRRGEVSNDGRLDISDAVQTLLFLFGGGREPSCRDAADATDDGSVDITDPIYTLNYVFLGGREIPAPGPSVCGPDETPDGLPECVEPCAA